MAGRPIIRIGDKTTHGGTVTEGFPFYTIDGRAAAGLGHMVTCPQCKGAFPIVEGVSTFAVDGGLVAIEGMKTSCGATLIASQGFAVVEPSEGGIAHASSDAGSLANGLVGAGAGTGQPLSDSLRQAYCDHTDTAVKAADYIVREMKTNPFSIRGRQIYDANHYDINAYYKQWEDAPWYGKLSSRKTYMEMLAEQKLRAYALWADIVGPGQQWDHKLDLQELLKAEWNKGWHKYGDHDYFYDIWSNIHYGYVGVAVGFTAAELINGAGIAQALDDAARAIRKGRLPTMQSHPENGSWPASADDRPDHISIKLGCDLYAVTKPHELTRDVLLQTIAAAPLPWGAGGDKAKKLHVCGR